MTPLHPEYFFNQVVGWSELLRRYCEVDCLTSSGEVEWVIRVTSPRAVPEATALGGGALLERSTSRVAAQPGTRAGSREQASPALLPAPHQRSPACKAWICGFDAALPMGPGGLGRLAA